MHAHPKLVIFDLDGTLTESKQPISAPMGELLGELLGVMPVAVMSGAGFAQFERQFLPMLPEHTRLEHLYLFPTSAAQCFVYEGGRWKSKYDNSLNTFEKARIMRALEEAIDATSFDETPTRTWGERIEDRGGQLTFSALGQKAPVDVKKEWNMRHGGLRRQLHAALMVRLPDFSVVMGGLTTIDITKKGISKAYGVRQLIEMTGISVSEMLYIGDALSEGGNDAVVLETGIRTQEVFGPEETALIINDLLNNTNQAHAEKAA